MPPRCMAAQSDALTSHVTLFKRGPDQHQAPTLTKVGDGGDGGARRGCGCAVAENTPGQLKRVITAVKNIPVVHSW